VILFCGYVPGRGRPTLKELGKKIRAARKRISAGDWIAADAGKLLDEFNELADRFDVESTTAEDQSKLLMAALNEINPTHYCGRTPPMRSTLSETKDLELWEFRWQSKEDCFKKSMMYMKFCVVGTGENEPIYVHSLHIDRPPQKEDK
jgi:hypothetical protein